jgi:chromosome partitioning protein
MIEVDTDGLTQRALAEMAGVSPATVSRYIGKNGYKPIDTTSHKNLRYSIKDSRKLMREVGGFSSSVVKKRQCFYNFKGGVGKTSLCFQVSSHIALLGYKVLVVDADPQAHLSISCGLQDAQLTTYDKIVNNVPWHNIVKEIFDGYYCAPSNLSLTRLEAALNQMPKREERLKIALEEIENEYDFIFIDTNPTISSLNRNVVSYSDLLNVVCETQPYSLNGLQIVTEDLISFYKLMQIEPKPIHIIPNKYEDRASSSAEAMTVLREHYGKYIKPDFAVRKSEDINTSAKLGKPLAFFAKKNSIAFNDVMELVKYILAQSVQSK